MVDGPVHAPVGIPTGAPGLDPPIEIEAFGPATVVPEEPVAPVGTDYPFALPFERPDGRLPCKKGFHPNPFVVTRMGFLG